jgi:hypothetical protein
VLSKGKVLGNYYSEIFEYHVSWGSSVVPCQLLAQGPFAFESNQDLRYMGTAPAAQRRTSIEKGDGHEAAQIGRDGFH